MCPSYKMSQQLNAYMRHSKEEGYATRPFKNVSFKREIIVVRDTSSRQKSVAQVFLLIALKRNVKEHISHTQQSGGNSLAL